MREGKFGRVFGQKKTEVISLGLNDNIQMRLTKRLLAYEDLVELVDDHDHLLVIRSHQQVLIFIRHV